MFPLFQLQRIEKIIPIRDLAKTILNTTFWFIIFLTHGAINPYHHTNGKRRTNPLATTY
jgi:hypothetical protein